MREREKTVSIKYQIAYIWLAYKEQDRSGKWKKKCLDAFQLHLNKIMNVNFIRNAPIDHLVWKMISFMQRDPVANVGDHFEEALVPVSEFHLSYHSARFTFDLLFRQSTHMINGFFFQQSLLYMSIWGMSKIESKRHNDVLVTNQTNWFYLFKRCCSVVASRQLNSVIVLMTL